MKLNVKKFKEVIRKSTFNWTIDQTRLTFTPKLVKSGLKCDSKKSMVILNKKNDILLGMKQGSELEFNFKEPNIDVLPYLNLVDGDEVEIEINRTNIRLKEENGLDAKVNFCAPDLIYDNILDKTFNKEDFKNMENVIENFKFVNKKQVNDKVEYDDSILKQVNKISNIAGKVGNVYISGIDGKFYIEADNKANKHSNSVKFELCDIDKEDFSTCFDFEKFSALLKLVDFKTSSMDFYLKNSVGVVVFNNDEEKYVLISKVGD